MEAKMALGNRASWNVATVAFVRRWKTRNVPDASLYTITIRTARQSTGKSTGRIAKAEWRNNPSAS